jgi:hypothetical protein
MPAGADQAVDIGLHDQLKDGLGEPTSQPQLSAQFPISRPQKWAPPQASMPSMIELEGADDPNAYARTDQGDGFLAPACTVQFGCSTTRVGVSFKSPQMEATAAESRFTANRF